MIPAVPAILALALPAAASPAPPPAPYVPDLARWRLELLSCPGGWVTQARQTVTFRLVDPGDPNPPKEQPGQGDAYQDAEAWRPAAPEPEKTPEQLRQERVRAEAERKANAWRQRTVRAWFNGEELPAQGAEVNVTGSLVLDSRNGENRLELLEPDSGARAGCSWWVSTGRNRLEVRALREYGWGAHPWSLQPGTTPPGNLRVLEPDGTLAESFRTTPSGGRCRWDEYLHAAPPPGTYSVQWQMPYWGSPALVTVEVLLDPGTDRERRWRFTRLILPGSLPAVLGTFDVDP